MSGRIRTIKPELLEDAITAGLSDMAFRLFVACILLADDYGNLRFEPEWVRGQVYWSRKADSEQFSAAMSELSVVVTAYEVKSQRYGAIKNWAKHQRVAHPGKPRVPGLAEALPRLSGDPLESLPRESAQPTEITGLMRLSGGSHETLMPDHRSPITDHRSPTKEGEPSPVGDPTKAPEWFGSAIETVEAQTGEKLRPADSWLRYSGHRGNKGISKNQQDAVYWLTTVMVPEARKERREESDRRERENKRAGPTPPHEPQKLTEAEQKRFADQLRQRMAQRKGVA